ncbi:cobalt ECF transporter T component CbiQ [Pannus brasiliensis CCIBt3594]|uniref:Cobalt ECF transporter T component CbiQ n=1 Tax=Pannus brasiliensis CCIBt3594 TaxID=1427578 RepID=A0AAW9QRW0_9CHRO
MLLSIGAFSLAIDSQRPAPWQKLAPRTRVLCALLMVFAVAGSPNGHWWTWAIYGAGIALLAIVSRVTFPVLLGRVAIEFVFIGLVILGTLFREGGEVLWSWGFLRITDEGLILLGSVALKAFLSLVTVNILVLTTSVPDLLQALVNLKIPPLLVAIIASMVRYIALLIEEFTATRRAALSRNLMGNPGWQRLVLGNMIGSLFLRTLDRGERVYQAMLSRGYTGIPPAQSMPKMAIGDILTLFLTVSLILFGQIVYLFP